MVETARPAREIAAGSGTSETGIHALPGFVDAFLVDFLGRFAVAFSLASDPCLRACVSQEPLSLPTDKAKTLDQRKANLDNVSLVPFLGSFRGSRVLTGGCVCVLLRAGVFRSGACSCRSCSRWRSTRGFRTTKCRRRSARCGMACPRFLPRPRVQNELCLLRWLIDD